MVGSCVRSYSKYARDPGSLILTLWPLGYYFIIFYLKNNLHAWTEVNVCKRQTLCCNKKQRFQAQILGVLSSPSHVALTKPSSFSSEKREDPCGLAEALWVSDGPQAMLVVRCFLSPFPEPQLHTQGPLSGPHQGSQDPTCCRDWTVFSLVCLLFSRSTSVLATIILTSFCLCFPCT